MEGDFDDIDESSVVVDQGEESVSISRDTFGYYSLFSCALGDGCTICSGTT